MAKLASMSVDALLKMRDEIGEILSRRTDDLKRQLSALTGMGKARQVRRKTGKRKTAQGPKGRCAVSQQERPQANLVRPRRDTALDESRNEGHETHERELQN